MFSLLALQNRFERFHVYHLKLVNGMTSCKGKQSSYVSTQKRKKKKRKSFSALEVLSAKMIKQIKTNSFYFSLVFNNTKDAAD